MRKHRRLSIPWLLASLMLTTLVAMPIAFLSRPALIRWKIVHGLTHADEQVRQRSLAQVARRAGDDIKLRDAAIKVLSVPDDLNFQQVFHALDMAGQWRRPPIPDDAWLRWLNLLGNDPNPEARIMAIRQAAELRDLAADDRLLALFDRWLVEKDQQVRYNTLIALANLASHAAHPQEARRRLADMTDDPLPAIAAEAWVFLGLMDPISGRQANWRDAPAEVAAAMLWAATITNPRHPQPAIEALNDPTLPPALRAMAAYALSASDQPQAGQALAGMVTPESILIPGDATGPQAERLWLAWRAILGQRHVWETQMKDQTSQETSLPALWAALHQQARQGGWTDAFKPWLEADRLISHPVSAMAILEGLKPGSAALPSCPPDAPPYVRLAWTRAAVTPEVAAIRELMASDSAPMRDLACVTAWRRFDDDTNGQLIISLLRDYNDNAKRSGAILAGLTNLRPTVRQYGRTIDLLLQKAEDEDVWTVQQIHRIGLWMQGRLPEMDAQFTGLLSREDMPASTLLLALFHRHPQLAMNELFSPLTDPPRFRPRSLNDRQPMDRPVTLLELLVDYRWWGVLESFMPAGTPPFWVWADQGLQEFQLQVIRNHWLLHRSTADTAASLLSDTQPALRTHHQ